MRGLGLLLVIAGCGRVSFDLVERTDSAIDTTCWPAWRNGTVRLTTPQPIASLNTATSELDPVIAHDDRTLYFARGPITARDIFVATRADRTSPFASPTVRPDISSPGEDGKLTLAADGLSLVISVDRTTPQTFDLWQLSRATEADLFSSPTVAPLAQVNSPMNERDPQLSADGLMIYFALSLTGGQQIAVATRSTTSVPFDAPSLVEGLSGISADPALSPDGLVIIFNGAPDMTTPGQILYATRTVPSRAFEAVQPVPDIATPPADDGDPQLTADGCELFFTSRRSGNADLFHAVVQQP